MLLTVTGAVPLITLLLLPVQAEPSESKALATEIDLRNQSEPENYAIAFCARGPLSVRDGSLTGHAFVALYQDDSKLQACTVKAVGFYPKDESVSGQLKSYFDYVPSNLSDDIIKNRGKTGGDCVVLVRVNKPQWLAVQMLMEEWGDSPSSKYKLVDRDCVSFVDESAKRLGLKRPRRDSKDWPISFIRQIAELNQ